MFVWKYGNFITSFVFKSRQIFQAWLFIRVIEKNTVKIYKGNGAVWSPIRSVITRVINKIGRPQGVKCPFNFPTTRSNYKHDAHAFLLVLKSGW